MQPTDLHIRSCQRVDGMTKHDAIICDIDGTLAIVDNTSTKIHMKELEAHASFEVNKPIKKIVNAFYNSLDEQVILVSGRHEKYREYTEEWLIKNNISYDALYMRKDDDNRKDFMVKEEIYNNEIKGKWRNIIFVIDDRDSVVRMWRSLGLTTLQCKDGDY